MSKRMRNWTKTLWLLGCTTLFVATSLSRAEDVAPAPPVSESQKQLIEAYVAAVNAKDVQKLKACLHPKSIASITDENSDFFEELFARQMKSNIPKDYQVRVNPVRDDQIKSMAGVGTFPITPTHMIQIEWNPSKNSTSAVVLQVVQDGGKWYEMAFVPTQQTLDGWRARKSAEQKK